MPCGKHALRVVWGIRLEDPPASVLGPLSALWLCSVPPSIALGQPSLQSKLIFQANDVSREREPRQLLRSSIPSVRCGRLNC